MRPRRRGDRTSPANAVLFNGGGRPQIIPPPGLLSLHLAIERESLTLWPRLEFGGIELNRPFSCCRQWLNDQFPARRRALGSKAISRVPGRRIGGGFWPAARWRPARWPAGWRGGTGW